MAFFSVNWFYRTGNCTYWVNCSKKSSNGVCMADFSHWNEIFQSLGFSCESSGLGSNNTEIVVWTKITFSLSSNLSLFCFCYRRLLPNILVFYTVYEICFFVYVGSHMVTFSPSHEIFKSALNLWIDNKCSLSGDRNLKYCRNICCHFRNSWSWFFCGACGLFPRVSVAHIALIFPLCPFLHHLFYRRESEFWWSWWVSSITMISFFSL